MYDILIIGGGASGMTTAIVTALKKPNQKIGILEKNNALGKKLLATGNGKCNLTNSSCINLIDTVAFFNSIGVATKAKKDGRMYPFSEEAKDVVTALRHQIVVRNIETFFDSNVESVEKKEGGFLVFCGEKSYECRTLVIATGGKASPTYGTIGDGYRIAKRLGHRITSLAPILTPIVCKGDFKELKGIRAKGEISLLDTGNTIFREKGEIQFTADGLSGIPVFNLTQYVGKDTRKLEIVLDFFPDNSYEQLEKSLMERTKIPELSNRNFLMSMVSEKLALDILNRCEVSLDGSARYLLDGEIKLIAYTLKRWKVNIESVEGWRRAQVTKGGIPLDEIKVETFESKLVKDLYIVGEILDMQGPCGGFNLQVAWETAIKAGRALSNV